MRCVDSSHIDGFVAMSIINFPLCSTLKPNPLLSVTSAKNPMPLRHSGELLNCKHGLLLSEFSTWSIHLETFEATTLHIDWDVKCGASVSFSYSYKEIRDDIVNTPICKGMETSLLTSDVLTLDVDKNTNICLTWNNSCLNETSSLRMRLRVVLVEEEIERIKQSKIENEKHHLKWMEVTEELNELEVKKLDTKSATSSMQTHLSELECRRALVVMSYDFLNTNIEKSRIELDRMFRETEAINYNMNSLRNVCNRLARLRRRRRTAVTFSENAKNNKQV